MSKNSVTCEICKKPYKLITQLHLKTKHGTNLEEYQKLFPDAKIRPDYECEVCGTLVTHRKSSRAKYCEQCAFDVNKENVLYNVRKYNKAKKQYLQAQFVNANKEYGLMIEENAEYGLTRIDNTHSAWDFIPHKGQNVLGTLSKRDLDPDKQGRIPALKRLRKQMEAMKKR